MFVPPLPAFVGELDVVQGYFPEGTTKKEDPDMRGVDGVGDVCAQRPDEAGAKGER